MLIACYGFGYAVSLASFRGGPVFPAVMLGVAFGGLLGDLPGLGGTPAIAIAMAAMTVSMLRFPVASILLVAILLASSALPAMPIIILATVTAFIVTELIDPRAGMTGLRERLRRREPLAVAFLDLGSPVSADVTARSGFDVVVVDLEHGAGDENTARAQIQAADPHAAVVVRVPEGPAQIGRMLDAGASGVIVPQVGSVEEAERAGRAVRYAGTRGISPFSRGNRFGQAGPDFRAEADAALACIVQIERASALEAVDAIAALDDVDGLLMGPADLSADLGCELDLAGAELRGRRAPDRRRSRAARQDGRAPHGPRGSGAGLPRARLYDVLLHVREQRARGRFVSSRTRSSQFVKSLGGIVDQLTIMRQLFDPAVGLLSRLRFAHKFALIGLVLVVAVAVVGRAYVQTQNAQIAFSAKERVGIRVIEPSGELLAGLALARAAAVRGDDFEDRLAAVDDAVAKVDAAVEADGAELALEQDWAKLRGSIEGTLGSLPGGVAERSEALGALTAGAAALIVKAGDTSNLILDPDLDSFYVMDALVTKAPGMVSGPRRRVRPGGPRRGRRRRRARPPDRPRAHAGRRDERHLRGRRRARHLLREDLRRRARERPLRPRRGRRGLRREGRRGSHRAGARR